MTMASRPVGAAATASLPASAEIAIVGAGVMGLALAYNLALAGQKRVVVVDAHYLAWGASGRNGGGVRQQWSTEMNIRLMQESIDLCAGFAREMGINVWMRRGGYLFLARTEAARARMERNVALQNLCQVSTRMIDLDQARAIVPELAADSARRFAGACFNATDGIVFPWPFLWGYARAAARRGVSIHTATPVTAIERRADGGFALVTPKGTLVAARVVCAAGAWSPRVARLAGVELPDWPARHEILSTEPLKPFLKPMVSVLESGLYFSQSLRGEVVGGIALDETDGGQGDGAAGGDPAAREVRMGSRLAFLEAMARGMTEVMPLLGDVKVVRQWAGPYDMSPDGNPLVGPAAGLPGFFVCCGFEGHGFMMAPVVARHYARYLTGEAPHPLFAAWRPDRFTAGGGGGSPGAAAREDMTIG
jgi:sarcosine oxidase subunit beta